MTKEQLVNLLTKLEREYIAKSQDCKVDKDAEESVRYREMYLSWQHRDIAHGLRLAIELIRREV